LGFSSPNFDKFPPNHSQAKACNINIQKITDIQFFGDFLSNIVEIFERFIRDTIEREIEKVGLRRTWFPGKILFGRHSGSSQRYLAAIPRILGPSVTDPLYVEQTTTFPPPELVPLDLLDTENSIGLWFNQALRQVDTMLAATVPDQGGPTGTGRDLGINVLMRDSFLDKKNRALVVNVSSLPIDAVLFQGHRVKILGLDTLTLFDPLDRIGSYTLQSELTLQTLALQFDVSVEICQHDCATDIANQFALHHSLPSKDCPRMTRKGSEYQHT
jgi:hypothetical protein